MKLRQKLAAVLATAMVVSAIPVVTMAESENTLSKGIITANKDDKVTAATLKVDMKDAVSTDTTFFVSLKNSKWNVIPSNITTSPTEAIRFTKNSDTELQVDVKATSGTPVKKIIPIPLAVELTGGDATVAVDGNGTEISDMAAVVFARTSDSKASVKAADAKNIYYKGTIADITIEEPFKGVLGNAKDITVTLDNPDYTFVNVANSNFTLTKGYATGVTVSNLTFPVGTDKGSFTFRLNQPSTIAPGRVEIKGLQIVAKDRKPAVDDVINVTVSGDNVAETSVKVAVSKPLSNTVTMKDDKVVDVVAGTKKDITFTVKENVDDSILDNRTISVNLDKGYFYDKALPATSDSTLIAILDDKIKVKDETVSFAPNSWSLIKDDDDNVTGFEFTLASGLIDLDRADEIKFEDVTVYMPLDEQGDAKITVGGRAIGEDISVVAMNAKAPITVAQEALVAKVGLKEQKGGKLTITETDKAMLKQGKNLVVAIDDKADGFKFSDEPTVKVVSGDVLLDTENIKVSANGDYITIPVKRASKTASVIEVSDIPVNVDRTVPQGNYSLKVYGDALEKDHTYGDIEVKDFIQIATPNTEDIATNGLRKGKASFVIGSSKYVVNGIEADMDGAVYSANGRTMVPVRYVANALGVSAKDIYFANGTVTVMAGNKTISLEVGSKVAKLNGAPARVMTTAPVVKAGRVYVPVSEIGALLGVEAKYDAATSTATFINE